MLEVEIPVNELRNRATCGSTGSWRRHKRMQYVITLVHGTYGRRSTWYRLGSAFCSRLQTDLAPAVEVHSFEWSGRNSIDARSRAAASLASELRSRISMQPNARHFLIGHSHGGNVALAALKDNEVRTKIAGVVCL